MGELLEAFSATRINRAVPIITLTLIPFAITNTSLTDYFLFVLPILLTYSAISILNSLKDKDHNLTNNSKKASFIILFISIFLSIFNKYVFIYILVSSALGFIYNEYSRKIVLGDSLVAGLTHFSLPFFFAGLNTNLNFELLIPVSIMLFFLAPTIAPITNIKDIKKDIKNKHKTLINSVKSPQKIINYNLIFLLIIFLIIHLNLGIKGLIFSQLILSLILIKIKKLISTKNYSNALFLLRIYLTSSYLIIIIFSAKETTSILLASVLNLQSIFFFIKNYK